MKRRKKNLLKTKAFSFFTYNETKVNGLEEESIDNM